MDYAIVQTDFETPSVDQLKVAFQAAPGLTSSDAAIIGRDAFGILRRGLSLPAATLIRDSLCAQSAAVEMVDEKLLPQLPPSCTVQRLDCTDAALIIYDPLGRPVNISWDNVRLIAAGNVTSSEIKETRTERTETRYSPIGGMRHVTVTERRHKEENPSHWLMEIVAAGLPVRYSLVADKCPAFLFNSLGERRTQDFSKNFQQLIQLLLTHATAASTNRGAEYLRTGSAATIRYPGKGIFWEEMTWILWKMGWSCGAPPAR